MKAFTVVTAVAAPLPRANINTDDIWPGPGASPVAKLIGGKAFSDPGRAGENAFSAWRFDGSGARRPEFVLNQAPYDRAKILVAGPNFGCGSSREMAVWALSGIGIRAVIAPSFGDIFYGNCFKNGLLPVRLPQAYVDELLAAVSHRDAPELTVDLVNQQIEGGGLRPIAFEVVEYYRQALLNGLDEISSTLSRLDRIRTFEADYRGARPWLTF